MAADPEGSGRERATVALVSEQVKNLGLLLENGIQGLQRQLDAVAGIPTKLAAFEAAMRSEIESLRERVRDLEDAKTRFPALMVSVVGVVCAGLGVLIAYLAQSPHP